MRRAGGKRLFDVFYMGKFPVGTMGGTESLTYQPHVMQIVGLQHVYNALVLLGRGIAQFPHVAQDSHLIRHLHKGKVVDGSLHAGRVGVVGIHNQLVMGRYGKL